MATINLTVFVECPNCKAMTGVNGERIVSALQKKTDFRWKTKCNVCNIELEIISYYAVEYVHITDGVKRNETSSNPS